MFVIVPAIDGVPQIGYRHLYLGTSISPTKAVCHISDGPLEQNWTELTEAEFLHHVPEPMIPIETTEEKLTRLEQQNLILMDALATTFEEILALREIVEGGTA